MCYNIVMEKKYIKMNNNQNHLSLGNFCRLVKEISLNKVLAGQTEVFCTIFNTDYISDSTINNYCIGYRAIGQEFKEKYFQLQNSKNQTEIDEIIQNLMAIIEGKIYNKLSHEELLTKVNNNDLLKKLCLELLTIAKNDSQVNTDFTEKILKLIEEKNIYQTIITLLFFIVLEKKQPLYQDKKERETIENILNNTNISITELEKVLKLQFQDGINYTYSLKKLAKENNPYACFELGEMEYNGLMTGTPRYIKSYEYYKVAALKKHPRANWLIAKMFYTKKIGNLTKEDLNEAWKYLTTAENLGSIAAINTIGFCYLNGYVPNEPKSLKKAIEYFEKAATYNYVYAFNNLGRIYENQNNYQKAFEYYLKSATLEESWACNKVAEYYRTGKYIPKDLAKAFHYYTLALNVPVNIKNYWAMYNLAKYFYKEGCYEANVEKNTDIAINYLKDAYNNHIEKALEELIDIYIDKYLENPSDNLLNQINEYLQKISTTKYYKQCQENIKTKLSKINKPLKLIKLD